ncbi:MAG: alpha/beta hydrolase [Candidatus Tectimicrobiota bacterium]
MLHRLLNALILLPDRCCYQVPEDLGLRASAITFANALGQPLHGWWFAPCEPTAAGDDRPGAAPVIVFCPGTSGNLSSHLYYIELLCRAGCWVLGFDYTGFGRSAGQASLHTLVPDVLCAGDFLRREKGVRHFGIFGISLGANLALQVASQRPDIRAVAVEGLALYSEITRGVLEDGVMGPRSIRQVAYQEAPLAPRRPHVLNTHLVCGWLARGLARAGAAFFPFAGKDPRLPARQLSATPVFCIHGVDDPLLPFEATLQVYEVLPGVKQLWLIPAVGHAQEAVLAQDGEYVAQLGAFFRMAFQERQPETLQSMTCRLVPHGADYYDVQLCNAGAPGMALVTVIGEQTLVSKTLWVETCATFSVLIKGQPPSVHCLRLLDVHGKAMPEPDASTRRGQQYRACFQPLIRALSRALHERRWHEIGTLVERLPDERPESPFDFFLGIYCVQIVRLTRRKMPHVARLAAQAFTRYWHYGPGSVASEPSALQTLLAAELGQSEPLSVSRLGPS